MASTAHLLDALESLQAAAHKNSVEKGFWDGEDNRNVPSKLMLVVSELAEWLEAYRKNNPLCEKNISILDGKAPGGTRRITAMEEEAADVFIRLLDLCEHLKIDLGRVTLVKMSYNRERPAMHGGKRC